MENGEKNAEHEQIKAELGKEMQNLQNSLDQINRTMCMIRKGYKTSGRDAESMMGAVRREFADNLKADTEDNEEMIEPGTSELLNRGAMDMFDLIIATLDDSDEAAEEKLKDAAAIYHRRTAIYAFCSMRLREINKMLKEDRYEGKTLDNLLDAGIDKIGRIIPGSLFAEMIKALKEKEGPRNIDIKQANAIDFPLDKPNSYIWRLLETDIKKQTPGQLKFDMCFDMAKTGSNDKDVLAYYSVNFEDIKDASITKRLTPYDKRVYVAAAALFNKGNSTINLSQLYYAMGYTKRLGKNDFKKIYASLQKMSGARIMIDNGKEASVYGYDHFKYSGQLLPMEQLEQIKVNSQISAVAIHFFREPPLVSFARSRKQITSVPMRVLQSNITKTDANLLIEDYLIERISRAALKGKAAEKIILATLYEHANITTSKQRLRAPEKIKAYLDHYMACGMITDYDITEDAVSISITTQGSIPEHNGKA